jgi:hypothetical protein
LQILDSEFYKRTPSLEIQIRGCFANVAGRRRRSRRGRTGYRRAPATSTSTDAGGTVSSCAPRDPHRYSLSYALAVPPSPHARRWSKLLRSWQSSPRCRRRPLLGPASSASLRRRLTAQASFSRSSIPPAARQRRLRSKIQQRCRCGGAGAGASGSELGALRR